jgi:hypothetical protein
LRSPEQRSPLRFLARSGGLVCQRSTHEWSLVVVLAVLVRWHALAWAPEISVRDSEHVNLRGSSTHADGLDHRPAHATEPASSHERPARSRPTPRPAALTFGRLPCKRPRPLLLCSPAARVLHRRGVAAACRAARRQLSVIGRWRLSIGDNATATREVALFFLAFSRAQAYIRSGLECSRHNELVVVSKSEVDVSWALVRSITYAATVCFQMLGALELPYQCVR